MIKNKYFCDHFIIHCSIKLTYLTFDVGLVLTLFVTLLAVDFDFEAPSFSQYGRVKIRCLSEPSLPDGTLKPLDLTFVEI